MSSAGVNGQRSSFDDKLDAILARHDELQSLMSGAVSSDFGALAREFSEIEPIVAAINAWRASARELADLDAIARDATADPEMRDLAFAEKTSVAERVEAEQQALRLLLLPRDAADARSSILEIRAGTGGDEAGLFAGDLLRMYQRYADLHGWRFELLSASESDLGGFKEVTAEVNGNSVFAKLKFEAGVHRVQRVPVTEAGGRIHTSAATVAVLPEAEEVDVDIDETDLRIDVYRASGSGGQHVNKTESAVRITHLPTNTVVAIQDEKSQHKNKAKALKILRSKLFDAERARLSAERSADRRGQVGSGDRSERIRTYNFPQGRVTDHRINLTLYKLDDVLAGNALDELIEALIAEDQAARLADAG